MKKRNIFLFILSGIFFIGILCIIAGIHMGGTLFSFHLTPKTSSKAYTESGFMTLSDKESSQITGVDFDIQAQEVVIQPGDSYGIETENDNENNRYHSYIKDGIWHVETPDNARANVTILDHTVYIPFGHRKANASPYTITLPSDVTFDKAKISLAAGECRIKTPLTAGQTTIKIGAGALSATQLQSERLNIKIGAGEGIIDNLQVTDQCTTKVGVGNLELGKTNIVSNIHNLHSETAMGNTEITGKLTGNNTLKCSTGNLDLTLAGRKSNYSFSTNTTMGDITFEKDSQSENTSTENYGDVTLKCSMGAITVDFIN